MNISFLIKGVSIWIELTLIFFHLSNPKEEAIKPCSFGASNCQFQCKARGYRHAVCNYAGCTCFHYYQAIGYSFRCQLTCDKSCQTIRNGDTGMCDSHDNCICYMEQEKMAIKKNQCLVTEKYCHWKCNKTGLLNADCSGDFCICHSNGQHVQLLDYKTGHCALPRHYCHSRCIKASFKDGGHCFHTDCVCTDGKDLYFHIDLEDLETMCESCRRYCEEEWVAKGTCVSGECICVNGDWYMVGFMERQQRIWGFGKDFCMKICADRNYHTKAFAIGYASCLCGQDTNITGVILEDTTIKPVWKQKNKYT